MTNSKVEATFHGGPRPYAIAQVIARKLYDDKPALDRLAGFLIDDHVEHKSLTRVDDEHRVAFSFGQLVHASDCRLPTPGSHDWECTDDCVILPCSEADASVVMMMIEFGIDLDGAPIIPNPDDKRDTDA